jgi:hypothetical protein
MPERYLKNRKLLILEIKFRIELFSYLKISQKIY